MIFSNVLLRAYILAFYRIRTVFPQLIFPYVSLRGGPNVNFNLQFIRTFYILRKGSVLFPCFSFVICSIHSAIWRLMEKKW